MEAELLLETIAQGESASVEFKRCGAQPEQDTFETICAFANHMGGSVYLGVEDNGTVTGVAEGAAIDIQRNIANVVRNPKLFDPAVMLETEMVAVNGKTVVRIWVPMSPDVHRYKGVVYDRIADADVKVSAGSQISAMYIRKSCSSSSPAQGCPGRRTVAICLARSIRSARKSLSVKYGKIRRSVSRLLLRIYMAEI